MLLERIEALKQQINALTADNQEKIEALRIKYLSKKGEVTALFMSSAMWPLSRNVSSANG